MFGTMDWGKLAKASTATLLMVLLSLHPIATHPAIAAFGRKSAAKTETTQPSKLSGKLTEVAPPAAIQELRQAFDDNQPQVAIVSPRANEVLDDDTISVKFQVKDLALFKNKELGLGPHLHVFLDNQPYQAVYDPNQPLVLSNLTPGTHTIRAFASRPWHESFKNEGAYAQTTFHVFTKTSENSPTADLPLLTYSRPQASYGAEPIMLDFYLTNAPLHLVAKENNKDDISDWRIRCTVNGSSFVLDQWQPVWLKGFKPGKNWVQLEFLDDNGNPIKNAFNNTARVITYEPGGKDTLSQLVRGDLNVSIARGIVDANYTPPKPEPIPSPSPSTAPEAKPTLSPSPVAKPSPSPVPLPVAPVMKVTPKPETPKVEETDKDDTLPKSVETPKAIAPTPTASPTAKPGKSPVKDFMSRFRKEPQEKKPISVPVVPAPSSPAPVVQPSPESVAIPKAVEIVPQTDVMQRSKPVDTSKVEAPKVELPKVEAPKVEAAKVEPPKTLIAPGKAESVIEIQPIETPKRETPSFSTAPKVIPAPTATNSPKSMSPSTSDQLTGVPPKPAPSLPPDSSQAAQDAQTQFSEKADELKTQMTSQFNQLRDRFRKTAQPKPSAPIIQPKSDVAPATPPLEQSTPAESASLETSVKKFPVIEAPKPDGTERSPVATPTPLPVPPDKEASSPPKPERITPAEQYYNRIRQNTASPTP